MKRFGLVMILTAMAMSVPSIASASFFEWGGEKIIKVMELPQNSVIETESGDSMHIDLGYIYKQVRVLFIPLWNYDGRWIGYIDDSGSYLPLTRLQLEDISGVQLPSSSPISLWERLGGKILLASLVLLYFVFGADDEAAEIEPDSEDNP